MLSICEELFHSLFSATRISFRHIVEKLLHIPSGGRTAFGAETAVQANVFVFDHYARCRQSFGDV